MLGSHPINFSSNYDIGHELGSHGRYHTVAARYVEFVAALQWPTGRGINGYEWELFKLATYGVPPLPVFITETGWRHAESTDLAAADNGRPLPDALTVARYFELALYGNDGRYPSLPDTGWTPWLTDPRVIAIIPFALNGQPGEWGHTNWLLLDSDGVVSGTYPSFDVWAGVR